MDAIVLYYCDQRKLDLKQTVLNYGIDLPLCLYASLDAVYFVYFRFIKVFKIKLRR